jgi:hypothetical protein
MAKVTWRPSVFGRMPREVGGVQFADEIQLTALRGGAQARGRSEVQDRTGARAEDRPLM